MRTKYGVSLAATIIALSSHPGVAQHQHPSEAGPAIEASGGAVIGGVLWLADAPPAGRRAAADVPRSQGTSETDVGERAMNHADFKHLWLRQGTAPAQSAPVAAAEPLPPLHVVAATGDSWDVAPTADGGNAHAQIAVSEMGFYNAYLTRAAIVDGHLDATVAKAEVLKGTCCKKGVDAIQETAISDPGQPIELVRDHMPDEKLFTRLVSGDQIAFTVTSFGKPLAGAVVTLATQQGWSKTVVSGADGRVAFTLIRDYFPDWNKFWRLNRQTFLVTAEAATGPGSWQGQPFQSARLRTSLAGKYSPSPTDYRSYAFGLGISGGVLVFLGTAIYLYRRRRVRPFQEVRLDA
ncbi:MAG: hypothetical protein ACM31D_05275 [Bacteroidota bacterium]